ncbi:MAG: trans-aconitate 2-methyltransferase [Rhodobiaceae bacterium]|nr:trans-aconitate 2-methyltransferase [Rhodobiaceae bacterium]
MPTWSSDQYTKFEAERTRPARDLLTAVPLAEVRHAVDLGCGPGNSTELIVARYPDARVEGLDSAPDMIEKAKKRLPDLSFALADLTTWTPEPSVELVYANAVFQWVPDHVGQMRRIMGALSPGNVLAIQVPDNLREPSHVAMADVARLPQFDAARAAFGSRDAIPSVHDYVAALDDIADLDIWRTTYHHRLGGHGAIVEWVKGTGLRPFLEPLDDAGKAAFESEYLERIAAAYPLLPDGTVILPFPRLFIVAVVR